MKFQQKKLQMSQNLQNFVKFQKFQLANLVDFEKCCKNAYLLEKIGADTAENERKFAEKLPKLATTLRVARFRDEAASAGDEHAPLSTLRAGDGALAAGTAASVSA